MGEDDIFLRYLNEAPGDEEDTAPDIGGDNNVPDIPDDNGDISNDDSPPDIGNDIDSPGDIGDDMPPDLGEDDLTDDNYTDDGTDEENPKSGEPLQLDGKVSAIMNQRLYQQFLALLNTINNQIVTMKDNNDVLYILSPDTIDTLSSLKKLDENVRLYLKNCFENENYSKNLLFFNKCINLLHLINNAFAKDIRKGIKNMN